MRRIAIAGATALALAGIGHNMPPAPIPVPMHEQMAQAEHLRRRENKKLWQKRRRKPGHPGRYYTVSRFARKVRKFGPGYRPGKLFKGHRA